MSPIPGSGGIFDVQTNPDTIDYEDLGYHVEILSVALSDIAGYVAEERRTEKAAPHDSSMIGSPRASGMTPQIDLVRNTIDVVHGMIGKPCHHPDSCHLDLIIVLCS